MAVNRFYFITLTFLVLVLGYLSYQILKPFLSPIAWAIVLSLVFYPIYAFLLRYIKWRTVASFITLGIILIIILGPFSYLSFLLAKELKHISDYVEGGRLETLQSALEHPGVKAMIDRIISLFNITEAELDKAVIDGISKFGKDLVGRITKGMGDVVTVALNFVFMAFAIFFLLKDGSEFLKRILDYMPFSEEQKDRLTMQIRDIIISTVYGGVVVAIIQGIIAGFAFYILGIPSPVVWGLATSIASFIPLIGAFAVWGPATVYLFLQGAVLKGVALAIVGVFGISLIDNVLKPIIIGGRTKMPILAIFFSVLGGIKLFGLIGLVMGPLVLAIFVSVVEIFRNVEGGYHA
ncbi:AI-2E family transporter [Dissulfurispira sp.]|uniref:AI-2E family transporter n=1 Tax=Dissulfurispira sp. TaxID=2817609 RepID=UPI002FD9C2C6